MYKKPKLLWVKNTKSKYTGFFTFLTEKKFHSIVTVQKYDKAYVRE